MRVTEGRRLKKSHGKLRLIEVCFRDKRLLKKHVTCKHIIYAECTKVKKKRILCSVDVLHLLGTER